MRERLSVGIRRNRSESIPSAWRQVAALAIPNPDRAVIDPTKLREFLLSPTHPAGRAKSRFFASLGYDAARWRRLDWDLRHQHLLQMALELEANPYGRKFLVRATLRGPNGRPAMVTSIWIVRTSEDFPRFVTAYPGGLS